MDPKVAKRLERELEKAIIAGRQTEFAEVTARLPPFGPALPGRTAITCSTQPVALSWLLITWAARRLTIEDRQLSLTRWLHCARRCLCRRDAMKRRKFLKDVGLAGAGLACSSMLPAWLIGRLSAQSNGVKPNILIIMVDQLRFPQGSFDQSLQDQAAPNLAKLRQQSVSFNSHYAAATACS